MRTLLLPAVSCHGRVTNELFYLALGLAALSGEYVAVAGWCGTNPAYEGGLPCRRDDRGATASMTWTCCGTEPCRACSARAGRPRGDRSCGHSPGERVPAEGEGQPLLLAEPACRAPFGSPLRPSRTICCAPPDSWPASHASRPAALRCAATSSTSPLAPSARPRPPHLALVRRLAPRARVDEPRSPPPAALLPAC
jgi:hypothetical protein